MPFNCILCNKRLKIHQRRPVNNHLSRYLRKTFLLDTTSRDFICGKCSRPAYRYELLSEKENNSSHQKEQPYAKTCDTSTTLSPPSVYLKIPTTSKSHAYCFVCKKPGPKLVVVSASTKFDVFLKHNVLISSGSRCCPGHFDSSGDFTPVSIEHLKTVDHVFLNRTAVLDLLQKLRTSVQSLSTNKLSFDNLESYSDQDILNMTGLAKQHYFDIVNCLQNDIRNTPSRSIATTIGIFLMKMRTGISDKLLATLFSTTRSSIRRAIHSVRKSLMLEFVPNNLGFSHISRERVITDHTTTLAQSLFGDETDQAILVLDGTYIYIQKSNNFHFQRRSYSMHKGRPLVKPMVIVTTTGYFLSVLGPYFADTKNNDASILKHLMASNMEKIKDWIKPSDIFIVDRGFRDSLNFLEDLGIKTAMPAFMVKGEKQMSSEDANASRLVTKVRWVVEAANGKIKNWKYLAHILPTNQVPYIGDYTRIVCSIMNKYSRPVSTSEENDRQLAIKMRELSCGINDLKYEVETKFSSRSSCNWLTADKAAINDFPKMSEEQLRNITCGSYQLKMSTSYIQEHFDGNSDFTIHKDDDHLIRVKLQSRHVSSKTYLVWIRYTPSGIEAWYCKCRAGARVVGVCSHVVAVLWYLSYARHSPMQSYGVRDWGSYLDDAAVYPEIIDASSDSDQSVNEE